MKVSPKRPLSARPLWYRLSPSVARLAYRIRHFHVENKGLKLLSVLLAFLLFVVSRQPPREVLLIGVPIVYTNLRPGLEISSEVPATANVRLRGPQDVVRSITPNQIEIIADLSNKAPGERAVQLRPMEGGPKNIKVLRIEPSSVELRIEPTQRKIVPVEVQFTGQPAPGYERYSYSVEPPAVEIEGPQSRVNQVARVRTESVPLDAHRESFQTPVDVDLHKQGVRLLTPTPLKLTVQIGEHRAERVFTNVPVSWPDQPPHSRLLTPQLNVTLRGPRSIIEALHAQDVKAEIHSKGLPANVEAVAPKITWPADVGEKIEVVAINPKEVKVSRSK